MRRFRPRGHLVLATMALFALTVLAALAGCGATTRADPPAATRADGPTGTQADAPPTTVPPASGVRPAPVIYRPPGLSRAKAVPMVVGLHASGGTPASFEQVSGLDSVAQQRGFVVAYLGSLEPSSPAWTKVDMPANLAYVSSEIKHLIKTEHVDPKRVYVTGFSAGATMAFFVGCQLSSQIAGIAPVSGSMRFTDYCKLKHPLSELLVIGTNDSIPINGSARLLSDTQVAAKWRKLDGCSAQSRTGQSGTATEQTWSHCKGQVGVGLYVVQGGNHQWPGGPISTGPDSRFDAPRAVWAFFAAHSRGQ